MTIRRRLGPSRRADTLRDEIFQRIGATPHSVYPALVRAVKFGEGRDPNHALSFLGEYRYLRAIPLIVRTAWKWDASTDPERASMLGGACYALGRMDDPRAHRELVRLYEESTDLWTRAFAVDAFGWEKRYAEPERVIRILQSDEDEAIRYHAMLAILEQVDYNTFDPYVDAVVAALRDQQPCVRSIAVQALTRAGRREFREQARPLLEDTAYCRYEGRNVGASAREAFEMFRW